MHYLTVVRLLCSASRWPGKSIVKADICVVHIIGQHILSSLFQWKDTRHPCAARRCTNQHACSELLRESSAAAHICMMHQTYIGCPCLSSLAWPWAEASFALQLQELVDQLTSGSSPVLQQTSLSSGLQTTLTNLADVTVDVPFAPSLVSATQTCIPVA